MYLSVIIPAYNEERRLPLTLRAVTDYLSNQSYSWEVTVVDDGSNDQTADIVRRKTADDGRVSLLSYTPNRGKGYAVRTGMAHTTGQFRLFMDADNSTTVDHFARFQQLFDNGVDVVIGSRDVSGAEISVHQSWIKQRLGDLGNVWIQLCAVPGIWDTQAGFKVFRACTDFCVTPAGNVIC